MNACTAKFYFPSIHPEAMTAVHRELSDTGCDLCHIRCTVLTRHCENDLIKVRRYLIPKLCVINVNIFPKFQRLTAANPHRICIVRHNSTCKLPDADIYLHSAG